MSLGERAIKAVLGLLVLVILFLTVTNWIGDYRFASGDGRTETETSKTVEATAAAGADAKAEPKGEEGAKAPAAPTGTTVTVLVDGLNFRAGASRESELIRGLDADEKLELLGEENGWLKVKDAKGSIGYVSASGSYTRIE